MEGPQPEIAVPPARGHRQIAVTDALEQRSDDGGLEARLAPGGTEGRRQALAAPNPMERPPDLVFRLRGVRSRSRAERDRRDNESEASDSHQVINSRTLPGPGHAPTSRPAHSIITI